MSGVFCACFLFTDANVSNLSVCQDITHTDPVRLTTSKRHPHHRPAFVSFLLLCLFAVKVFYPEQDEIEAEDIKEESLCLFYPTNVLNCSWSLDHVQAAHIVPLIRYFLLIYI